MIEPKVLYPSKDPRLAAARLLGFAYNDIMRIKNGETHLLDRTLKCLEDAMELLTGDE